MVSLPEELQAREAAARRRVGELHAEAAEVAIRLEEARKVLSRLEITRETVAQMLAELSATEAGPDTAAGDAPETKESSAPHGVGVMMVPPWREGLVVAVLPDIYRDIVEIIADAPGPLQAKQIVPRIGLPTTTGTVRPRPAGAGPEPGRLPVAKGLFLVDSKVPTKRITPEEEPYGTGPPELEMATYAVLAEPDLVGVIYVPTLTVATTDDDGVMMDSNLLLSRLRQLGQTPRDGDRRLVGALPRLGRRACQ